MTASILAALVLAQTLPWPGDNPGRFARFTSRTDQGRSDRGFDANGLAFFEFAPPSGTGLGTACACAAVTGAKGEALTFSRGSAGTCIKSNASTNIAAGDLVSCTNNLPRVMPGFDGTAINGLLVESSRTNLCTQSQAIDNVAFTDFIGTGGSAPTLNGANAVPGPWGTTTADAYTFAATTGAQASMRAFAGASAGVHSCGVFVKGQAGAGTTDICIETGAGPTATCAACAFTSTAYNWCKVEGVTSIASGRCFIGNGSALNGGTARSSNAVYVEQLDLMAGAWLGTPIATAGASATRSVETAFSDIGVSGPQGNASLAATAVAYSATQPASGALIAVNAVSGLDTSGTNALWGYNAGSGGQFKCFYGAAVTSAVLTVAGSTRAWCNGVSGTSVNGQYGASSLTPGGAPTAAAALRYVSIGGVGGFNWDSVIKQVCLDPDPTRCR